MTRTVRPIPAEFPQRTGTDNFTHIGRMCAHTRYVPIPTTCPYLSVTPMIELESVRDLPERERSWLPPIDLRMHQPVGASVRLLAVLNGAESYMPWVVIEEITDTRYVGRLDDGSRIALTADNVIEV